MHCFGAFQLNGLMVAGQEVSEIFGATLPASAHTFAPLHTPDVFLNRLISPHRDRYVKTPSTRITAVRLEKDRDVRWAKISAKKFNR